MKAVALKQVVINFDTSPQGTLTGEKLDAWFMEREKTPRGLMEIELSLQPRQKVLLVGHRGSGKSSELNKLAVELADKFHTIGFNVLEVTGRPNLEYEDLMLAISTQVTRLCIRQGLVRQPLTGPIRQKLIELRDWWSQVVAGTEFRPEAAEVEIGAQIETLLGQVEVGVRQSSLNRDAIRDKVNRQMPDLIRRLNWVVEQAEEGARKCLLIIVEGLDKVDLDCATKIFRDHAQTLVEPAATLIYTIPVSLYHSDHFNTVRASFTAHYSLRNLAARDRHGMHNSVDVKAMRNLILARMEEHLIEPEALDMIIQGNGGIPQRIIFLMRRAALFALNRDPGAERIIVADAQDAIQELRKDLLVALTREDLRVLRERHHDRHLTNDANEQRLLYNGSLIDYSNGDPWCDAHPALWSSLQQMEERDGDANPDAE